MLLSLTAFVCAHIFSAFQAPSIIAHENDYISLNETHFDVNSSLSPFLFPVCPVCHLR
jgi:hypothetical protein